MARGGKRIGSGRPAGSKSLILSQALAAADSPLDFLLEIMRNPAAPLATRIDAAKVALPYMHQRCGMSVAVIKQTEAQNKEQERQDFRAVMEEAELMRREAARPHYEEKETMARQSLVASVKNRNTLPASYLVPVGL